MTEDDARTLATELYRGILKREPDEGGLEAYTGALLADGSPGRIADLMREFCRSEEAKHLDAKLRGIVGAKRSAPIGPINHVISLGTDCYASLLFKLAGWKRASYPFDWILSSPSMVADILRDDFADFLDPRNHRSIPIAQRRGPNERCADHLLYRERYGIDAIFMHRDITEPTHRDYYWRAVERFRSVMSSERSKLLLMTNTGRRHATIDDFANICAAIDRQYRNSMLIAVNFERIEDGDAALIGGTLEQRIGPHQLIRYRASSGLNGVTFSNWLDDLHIRGMLAQYTMDLVS